MTQQHPAYVAFDGYRRISQGPLRDVALAVKLATDHKAAGPLLVFDGASGKVVDLDLRGTDAEVMARASDPVAPIRAESESPASTARNRGRPRLGVVGREVTLLPRHWDWLNAQPGGASVALRKLVEEARRTSGDKDLRRRRQEVTYRFMVAIGGNLPGFEEAMRALFADDERKFATVIAGWPEDVRDQAIALAFSVGETE